MMNSNLANSFQTFSIFFMSHLIKDNEGAFIQENNSRFMMVKTESNETQQIPKFLLVNKEDGLKFLIELESTDSRYHTPNKVKGI